MFLFLTDLTSNFHFSHFSVLQDYVWTFFQNSEQFIKSFDHFFSQQFRVLFCLDYSECWLSVAGISLAAYWSCRDSLNSPWSAAVVRRTTCLHLLQHLSRTCLSPHSLAGGPQPGSENIQWWFIMIFRILPSWRVFWREWGHICCCQCSDCRQQNKMKSADPRVSSNLTPCFVASWISSWR